MGLLEREEALSTLSTAFARAREGRGCMALVSGEAGIGKTALVTAFAASRKADEDILWGRCDSLSTPRAHGPAYDIASRAGGRLLECLDRRLGRAALFAAFLAEMQRARAIFVFEDLHWADEATLDLVKYVGRRIGDTPALLIATFRDDDKAARERLGAVVGDIASADAVRIPLAPLSAAAVRELAGEDRGAQIHAVTGGNPFFVTEVIAAGDNRVPPSVRDAVLARAARLSPSARAALDLASIEPAGMERWIFEAGLGPCDDALAECVAQGVLGQCDGRLVFRHELARLAIADALGSAQAVPLHRKVLEALRARPQAIGLARLAHHADGAGLSGAVIEYATAAARACVALSAHREAAQHFGRAVRHAAQSPPRERARLLGEFAWECHVTARYDEAVAAREQALAIWRESGDPGEEAVTLAALAHLYVVRGEDVRALEAVRCALAVIEGREPAPAHAYVHRQHAYIRMLQRDVPEAIAGARRAIELARQFGDTDTLVQAHNTIGSALLVSDDMKGIEALCRSRELAARHGFEHHYANACGNLGSACGEVHRYRQAQGYLEEGIAYCLQHDLDHSRLYQQSWLSLVHLHRGHWDAAAALSREVLRNRASPAIARVMAWLCTARLRTRRGDPGSWAALDEALALASPTTTLQRLAPVHAARAEAAWLDGEPGAAAREAAAACTLALRKRHAWFAGELAYWQWKGGRLAQAPDIAAPAFAMQVQGRWKDAAAEWRARDCPYETARALAEGDAAAQVEALAIFERLGARPAASRVRQALRSAGVKRIPRGPRPATRRNAPGLTGRELEILALLVEGLTNAQIAQRLHISAKTVDHHVGAVLAKLGVSSRRLAARAAAEKGLVAKMG
jgi:DNA-binding CsgD family transcriptional regulator/tetratricopeptide (TPR) repeat protein